LKGPHGWDLINFLVDRKFGFNGKTTGGALTRFTAERLSQTNPGLAERITKYEQQLRSLPPDELKALCDTETNR
jgi:hypothetical protein